MEAQLLTTVLTGAVLAVFGLILAWQGRGRMDAFERQLESMRAEMTNRFDALHSDLLRIALAVGADPSQQTG